MVSKGVAERGEVVAILDYDLYTRLMNTINNNLPGRHVIISPERVKDQKGRKLVLLWCSYPKIGERAVKMALGEPSEREAIKQIDARKPYIFFPEAQKKEQKEEGRAMKTVSVYVHKRTYVYWKDRPHYTAHA